MFLACKVPPLSSPYFINPRPRNLSPARFKTKSLKVECGKRTGKRRYPSEKKKLEKLQKTLIQTVVTNREEGFWRLYKLTVPLDKDPGKDSFDVSIGLLEAIAKTLEFPVAAMLPKEAFSVVRKSFDARKILKEPKFVYTVDMDAKKLLCLEPRTWDFISTLEPKIGLVEYMVEEKTSTDLINMLHNSKKKLVGNSPLMNSSRPVSIKPKVAVVGSGPSGLFAALVLGELGAEVTLIERGKAVEQRGRDIGALVVRRILRSESNFCFGEGGAGTWSDGKLVTRIGKNSDSVQAVMNTLVRFGAPPHILVDGKPHLGTDRLVPLLRNFRNHLQNIGVTVNFDTRLDDLIVKNGQIQGIQVSDASYEPGRNSKDLLFDSVVLAVGHSARDVYQMLLKHNVDMIPKDFAVGLRIEHPQELVNNIQYSTLATKVQDGRGKIPVADYKLVKYVNGGNGVVSHEKDEQIRSCYSFCMCPGGQVVLTSTNPSELCINGMSFSKRSSRWANAALVVTVSSNDFDYSQTQGPLVGVEFQREFERKAAIMGGGNFVVPVQLVTDFLDNRLSVTTLPPSSYRLGVKASNLHEIYPTRITEALQQSIMMFDEELPGFITKDALLHGVETRTSSPVQIQRHPETYESTSLCGLYPVGEGAGYAGGIVSAAVDGMYCGFAVAKSLQLYQESEEHVLGKAHRNTGFVKY